MPTPNVSSFTHAVTAYQLHSILTTNTQTNRSCPALMTKEGGGLLPVERVQAAWRLPVESADMAGKRREASVLPRGRGLRGRKVAAIDVCMQ